MKTKMLNLNGKLLLGVFSVVLVITAIVMIPLVISESGKIKANDCMGECMKIKSEYFDGASEQAHACRLKCSLPLQTGKCEVHSDNCCVPFTGDPDCGGTSGGCTDVTVYVEGGLAPYLVWIEEEYSGETVFGPTLTDGSGITTCLGAGNYLAHAQDYNGDPAVESFTEPGTPSVTMEFPP